MNAKWTSCVVIAVATLVGLLGPSNKAAADVVNLNSVTQVNGMQIKGVGTYATGGTIDSFTMYVYDSTGKQVSQTIITTTGLDWASTTIKPGGLPKGDYKVQAELKATLNGVQTTTDSGMLPITIK